MAAARLARTGPVEFLIRWAGSGLVAVGLEVE